MGGDPVSDGPGSARVAGLRRDDSWDGIRAVVAGFGVSGFAAADNLLHLGAEVTVLDEKADASEGRQAKADLLRVLGADIRLGPGQTSELPAGTDLVVTSPGWRPDAPLLAQARAGGVPVWGEIELAWRLGDRKRRVPWLAVTGTNGKTTTVRMLAEILRAAGLRTAAVGNVGLPATEAVMDPEPYDVFAVELSSFQLHYVSSMRAESAAVLNVAEDHLDWYAGDTDPMLAYAADKGRIYQGVSRACVYNVADATTERLVREAEVIDGARAIGITAGVPSVSMLGVVDGILVDRAFVPNRHDSAAELCAVSDLADGAPHNVFDALAAAALARAHGVPALAVRAGLLGFRPDGHRIAEVAVIEQVRWVDDSKATNPHAAEASLSGFDSVVWIAGGLAKGARFDDLVRRGAARLRGVVLIGRDRAVIAEALARHAPQIPVIEVDGGETQGREVHDSQETTELMDRVVAAAGRLAEAGDTVLLAPGCASMDQFVDYAARGDEFAAAVRRRRAP
ncbi:MAG: UDP-N-acetylmuramoyl-L-alanine--D-glutamate ligase [Nocardioides sp.]